MEGTDPINSLPEYKIRTMKDDLSGVPEDLPIKPEEKPISPIKPIEPIKPIGPISPTRLPARQVSPISPISPIKPIEPPKPAEPISPIKPIEPIRPIEPIKLMPREEKPIRAALPTIEELINIAPALAKPISPISPIRPIGPIRPISPIRPIETTRGKSKFLLILGILILIAIIVLAFFYWQGTKPEPTPEPGQTENQTLELPKSLMPIHETEIVLLTNAPLFNQLIDKSNTNQLTHTFKRILPQRNKNEFIPLNDLIEELQISVYPYVFSELENEYTLVLYSQNNKISIGLLIKAKNPDKVREEMKFWEPTMANDLKNLFLDKNPGNTTTQQLKNNLYNETLIRYIPFANFDSAIDYAIKGNVLVLTTSKEAMFGIIDKL